MKSDRTTPKSMPQTINFPNTVPDLFGDTACLRELTEADIPAWFARATDAESADLAGDPIPESIETGAVWLKRHRDRFRQQTAIRWAIVPKGATESVGTVGFSTPSQERRVADLGIVVGRAYWGKGVGTSAANLALAYAFNTLGFDEIQAEVLQRNFASIRLLEKVGFRQLRTILGDRQSAGESEDCFLYGLSRPRQSAR
jgi:[ribosomal protein S5]-alanine N-acetyltransferase